MHALQAAAEHAVHLDGLSCKPDMQQKYPTIAPDSASRSVDRLRLVCARQQTDLSWHGLQTYGADIAHVALRCARDAPHRDLYTKAFM